MRFKEFGKSHYFATFMQMINRAPDFDLKGQYKSDHVDAVRFKENNLC
jgi:hypothetical protein